MPLPPPLTSATFPANFSFISVSKPPDFDPSVARFDADRHKEPELPVIGRTTFQTPAAQGDRRRERRYLAATLAAIAAITALRLLWLALQPADLYPDEAQYWFWAQHPAFGYYSKPPLVAWLIALTTGLFGDSELAVRLSAPLLHAGTASFIYAIGARLYDRRVGFWSALAYMSLPGVSVSAFIMSTDAALLPCWAAALYAFIRAREARGSGWWWLTVGIAAGFGLLAKYAMAYWLLSALGFVILLREERRHLPALLAATFVAFVIYSPNLWWNWQHGFASYLHTRDNAELGGRLLHPGAALEFFGSQFGVFGPLFFGALIFAVVTPRTIAEPRARLLAAFALPTLAMMLIVSLLSRAEPNWAAPAYLSAIVLVVGWTLQRGRRAFVASSIAVNLAAAVVLFGGYQALAAGGIVLPARYDPLVRLRGWRELGEKVGAALAAHPGFRLFADDREVLAALVYYVHPHPFGAVKWELMDRVKDQWDLTNDMRRYRGGNFLLVSVHHLAGEMRPSFKSMAPLPPITVSLGPGETRTYSLYLAYGFTGYPQYRH
ncbi:MAG: ArnT family glycosyltransferase [Stellaceae bacterium]